MQTLWRWFVDYVCYGLPTLIHTQFYRTDAPVFLSKNKDANPIIVIPGLLQRWNIFRNIIKQLNELGYPVYSVKSLKRNTMPIVQAAELVRKTIDENNLKNVILVSHSKGGLVGKYVLEFFNQDDRVKKLIAIATPFHGTKVTHKIPSRLFRELSSNSETIKKLDKQKSFHSKITSIYCIWDNSVIPTDSSFLERAKNIQIGVWGHQRIIFQVITLKTIINEVLDETRESRFSNRVYEQVNSPI